MERGLRRLRYFSVLAQELNFRRTAERLHITQPALSRAIAQLEDEVGARLLTRTNRRVALTAAGADFAAGCAALLGGLDDTITRTLKVAEGHAGTLTIGYTDTAIAGCLPDHIKTFRAALPQVELRLLQMYSTLQIDALADGTIDVGIMTGPVADGSLKALPVQRDRFLAVLPRDNPLSRQGAVDLKALNAYPFVFGDNEAWSIYNALLFTECEARGLTPEIIQVVPESRAILGLVACGFGISILPECLTRALDPRVCAVRIADLSTLMTTQAVWRADTINPVVARFASHLKSADDRLAPRSATRSSLKD